jgi:hypothetical protein
MDFTSLTGAVDASTIVTALIAIGAVLVLPKAAAWGVRTIKGLIR